MHVLDLLEQRLELIVGNRHDRPKVRPLPNKSFPHAPLVLGQEHAPKLGEAVGRIVEGTEDRFPFVDREREDLRLEVVPILEALGSPKPALWSKRASSKDVGVSNRNLREQSRRSYVRMREG